MRSGACIVGNSWHLFLQPYTEEADNYGLQVANLESLQNMTLLADRSGLQVYLFTQIIVDPVVILLLL